MTRAKRKAAQLAAEKREKGVGKRQFKKEGERAAHDHNDSVKRRKRRK